MSPEISTKTMRQPDGWCGEPWTDEHWEFRTKRAAQIGELSDAKRLSLVNRTTSLLGTRFVFGTAWTAADAEARRATAVNPPTPAKALAQAKPVAPAKPSPPAPAASPEREAAFKAEIAKLDAEIATQKAELARRERRQGRGVRFAQGVCRPFGKHPQRPTPPSKPAA
jgi:hypothetical protein